MSTIYNKLVRDNIIEMLDATSIPHREHIAKTDEEYEEKLFDKLLEEVKEVIQDKSREEIADLLQVIEAIKTLKGFTTEEIEAIRRKKLEDRGGFEKKFILEQS